MCIVALARPMPSVHQPNPPGLIHDGPRLLPPLARAVLFLRLLARLSCAIHNRSATDWCASAPRRSLCGVHADSPVVLTLVSDADLAASADRVLAAAGSRVLRTQTPGDRSWREATAVVLDESAARRAVRAGAPRREGVVLISPVEATSLTWAAAVEVGAEYVCVLPDQEADLVRHLAQAAERRSSTARFGAVVAVTAGPGGGGASVFASALAQCAGDALLMDLDPCGGGIDLLLGCESAPGLRWPDLTVQNGRLSWTALREVLPRQRGVRVLSGGRAFHEIDPGAAGAVLDAGRRGGVTTICDTPRHPGPAAVCAVQRADLVIVVTTCDVRGVAAATAVAAVVRTLNSNIGLVVRGPAPGGLHAAEVAAAASMPLVAAMRPEPMLAARLEHGGLRLRRRSPLARASRQVLDVLGRCVGDRAA